MTPVRSNARQVIHNKIQRSFMPLSVKPSLHEGIKLSLHDSIFKGFFELFFLDLLAFE
jgi:hypothetical protein